MATTTNFGWSTPDNTDLVKDGALAIRTLGSAIDTSLVDLKGGTTGQNLRKATNTDLDFTWAGDATNTVIDAEGDLLVGDSADTLQRLAIGTNGQVLTVDTTVDGKVKWGNAAAASALTFITSNSFTTSSAVSIDNCFTSTYANYFVTVYVQSSQNTEITLRMRVSGSDTAGSAYRGNAGIIPHGATSSLEGFGSVVDRSRIMYSVGSQTRAFTINFAGPQLADQTVWHGTGLGANAAYSQQAATAYGYVHESSTQFDGFTLYPSGGTITGTLRIYGVANS